MEHEEFEGEIMILVQIHFHDILMRYVYITVLLLVERYRLCIVQI